MNPIDQHKLIFIIMDSLQRLQFIGKKKLHNLGTIAPDHDISSELAGYEISKLLKD